MKHKKLLLFSVIMNGILILLFLLLSIKYKDKIIEMMISQTGNTKIVMFGNSLTAQGNWNTLLRRSDIKNSGFNGYTTSHFVTLINSHVIDQKPKICFLEGGINDIMVGIPLKRIKSNFTELIDKLLENNIVPVVQSTLYQENNPQSKIQIDNLNNFLVQYCKSNDIIYLDINSKLSTNTGLKPEYSVDGTHINKEAYEIWAIEIKSVLELISATN